MSDLIRILSALGCLACIFWTFYYIYIKQYDAAILYLLFAFIGCGGKKE